MSEPDLTVSIVNASNRDLVLGCLGGLFGDNSHRLQLEVVVLDNASEDGSPEAIRAAFPQAKVIQQQYRDGFGANQNRIFRSTKGRYILVLNDDAIVERGALGTLVEHMESDPGVAALAPRVVGPNHEPQQTVWRDPSLTAMLAFALSAGRFGFTIRTRDKVRSIPQASACALLLRRSALDRIGLFDERYFMYLEDSDLCRRLRSAGYEIQWFPEALVIHHSQQSSATVPERRIREHTRSYRLYWKKHYGERSVRLLSRLMAAGLISLAGIAWAIGHLPSRIRPARVSRWDPGMYLMQARYVVSDRQEPGLRELASDWNQQHQVFTSSSA